MKLWITGGQGMLGVSLQKVCEKRQISYVASSREEADLTDLPHLLDMARQIRPTHIINCAAYTNVDAAESEVEKAFAVNAVGAGNLASVAANVGTRYLHISTDYVFDGQSQDPYVETDRCAPINIYGQSKWEGEQRVMAVLPRACVIRTSWLFGREGKNLISSLIHWLRDKERIQVAADQCGLPTYVYDLAGAVFDLLDAEGIIHFANGGPISRYQLALAVRDELISRGRQVKCQQIDPVPGANFPTPARRPSYSVLSTVKFFQLTGKQPRPWKEALGDHLNESTL